MLLQSLILIQAVAVITILVFLYSLDPNVIKLFKTSFSGGPPPSGNVTERLTAESEGNGDTLLLLRLVFVSCNRQRMYNPFWKVISSLSPVSVCNEYASLYLLILIGRFHLDGRHYLR